MHMSMQISEDDWMIRVPVITRLAAKYYKPVLERFWLFFVLVITLFLPLVLYEPMHFAVYGNGPIGSSEDAAIRAIGFAIYFIILLVLLAPIYIWKMIGKRRVRFLLKSYHAMDEARSKSLAGFVSGFIPVWKLNPPSIFCTDTVLTITTPFVSSSTLFHPDAYLPAYIGNTEQEAYFYPYPTASREPGLPRMSVIGRYVAQEKV
ncbi:hypothetical protein K439DRAFT_1119218 [Ramaria rubella]|nr:hypothetical protein K439DRAFT_1119218 [Ramaria rubella]